jgi:hypothetical protein
MSSVIEPVEGRLRAEWRKGLIRILRYPNFSHTSIRSTIRAFRKYGGSGPAPGR